MRLLTIALMFLYTTLAFSAPPLPDDSVYYVGGVWQTQEAKEIQLESLAGKSVVMALVFTGCSSACPIIVESMKRIESQLPTQVRDKVTFVLVSLTPDTDYPKVLKGFAESKQLKPSWLLLRGNNQTVRALSNALNGRYKKQQDGDIAHSTTVTLLNVQGQIEMQAPGTLTGIKSISDKLATYK